LNRFASGKLAIKKVRSSDALFPPATPHAMHRRPAVSRLLQYDRALRMVCPPMKSAAFFLLAVLLWPVPAAAQVGNSCTTNGTSGTYNPTGTVEGLLLCSGGSWVYPAVQIGSTSATCNSTDAGILQWTGSVFQGCNGSSWSTFTTGSSTITLGTSASVTNPQRSGDPTTGLFSDTTSTVEIAAAGTKVFSIANTGILNIPIGPTTATYDGSYQLNGNNALWQDAANYNVAVGPTAFPTTVSQGGTNYGQYNTALGYLALNANTTGYGNTAVGYYALNSNTTGFKNTAIGGFSLTANSTAGGNTAVGWAALQNNTAGSNTAVGENALNTNTTGASNTAVGTYVLQNNTTGIFNVAVGVYALTSNTTGVYNTALGYRALQANTIGSDNTAVGLDALYENTGGGSNTAVGMQALYANTTGTNNTVIGYGVGYGTLNGGSNNILIGTSSAVDTPAAGTNNYLKIGTILNADMTSSTNGYLGVNLGNTVPTSPIQVGSTTSNGNGATLTTGGVWTNASDRRSKENIIPIRYGLADLMKLQSVSYDLIDTHVEQIGFIAQDVQKVVPEVVSVDAKGWYGLSYGNLVALAVKSIQELKTELDDLRRQTDKHTLDLSSYMRLAKNSSPPAECSPANDGAIALTHAHTLCICDGGAKAWVQSKDGTTACSW
jgi:hypothetical protein